MLGQEGWIRARSPMANPAGSLRTATPKLRDLGPCGCVSRQVTPFSPCFHAAPRSVPPKQGQVTQGITKG